MASPITMAGDRADARGAGPVPDRVRARSDGGDDAPMRRRVKSRKIDHTYRDFGQRSVEDVMRVLEEDRMLLDDEDRDGALFPLGRKKAHSFPWKLYDIITNPDYQHIICFMPHGRSWVILDKELLVSEVLSAHFNHSKFESFNRQVNGWGFKRLLRDGPDKKSYYHECFLRGRPELTSLMRRLVRPGKRIPDRAREPDFYAISEVSPLPRVGIKSPDVTKDPPQEEVNTTGQKRGGPPRASKSHRGKWRTKTKKSPITANTAPSALGQVHECAAAKKPAQNVTPPASASVRTNLRGRNNPALPAVDPLGSMAQHPNFNGAVPVVHQYSHQASAAVAGSIPMRSSQPQLDPIPTCMQTSAGWFKGESPPDANGLTACRLPSKYGLEPDPLRENFPSADNSVSLTNVPSGDPLLQAFAEIYFSSNPQDYFT